MQYADGQLWISTVNTIKCYRVRYNGTVIEDQRKRLRLNEEDVSRFVVKDNKVVSGCRYVYEPRHDKTCLREFLTRPDTNWPAQPQKLARVEISAVESKDVILS